MNATRVLRAAQTYTPLIKFKGHHVPPSSIDHSPQTHPASPSPLPQSFQDSFANYRQKSQQHGPLGGHAASTGFSGLGKGGNKISYGAIGAHSGQSLGKIEPEQGILFDRSELPERFRRMEWTQVEIDAVESAGASLW